jgi:ribosomal protein L22
MGKAKAERRLKDNEAQAIARTIRVSPQKLNLLAALIRGKKVATRLSLSLNSRASVAPRPSRRRLNLLSPTQKTTTTSTSTR